ncbi:MAG: aminotransferase class III-fold pyridoxal phosphate-dependent enzyme [Humidesulfovibrio sp.]|uniref:aminotransferase class III-fold pyridoxal phosphate-dependent enzyme n=1 Tax=Humidesulfovibrio sp. TaxID=2910988 RepID=UPI0027F387E2|nr:aminotransferase class III-fold pyridoxal phosphate-dependent enzyme [Humidesulfovibrio sp.]MDQ7834333.1 aminotransferase class III-fold pyridoxal phosphate-dependent enzyme [Humidesulfovibrio sp.]
MSQQDEIKNSYLGSDMPNSFDCYERAEAALAGPSTFSKGPGQFAYGITPFSLDHGQGPLVWDVDGHSYIDYILGLGSNILGYGDGAFLASVQAQLVKGIAFSLTTGLEIEVAELLREYIPCAELVRFGKNGSDVTSAAVRLARYVTGRDVILFCGYHGWQNWYAAKTSMSGGIPECEKANSVRFAFNDLPALEEQFALHHGQVACVIMEAIYKVDPGAEYLRAVKKLCAKNGCLLIFDEVITGFRCPSGSVQKMHGVTPDLACFSKALGNGFPVSALVGRREIMRSCEKIYFTLTNAGEAVSLAAARHVLQRYLAEDCPGRISAVGARLYEGVQKILAESNVAFAEVQGFAWRNVLAFRGQGEVEANVYRTLWMQETARRGVLNGGYHFLSLAHDEQTVARTLSIYKEVFDLLAGVSSMEDARQLLKCPLSALAARDV